MTSDIKITYEHNGTTYYGHQALIKRTSLGIEDHGIMTANLHLEWPSSGISFGGYCLDTYNPETKKREATAYGLDHIMKLCETVGVETWEALKGKYITVLFTSKLSVGTSAVGIVNIYTGKSFFPKEHAENYETQTEDF